MISQQIVDSRLECKPRVFPCESCGKQVEHRAGRRPRFCSGRCKEKARTRVRKAGLGQIPARPLFSEKRTTKTRPCKGPKRCRATAFSARLTFSPSSCSTGHGSPPLVAAVCQLKSVGCGRG